MKTLRLLFGLVLVATAFSVQAEDYSEKQHDKLIRECNRNNLESCVTAAIWIRDYLEAPAHAYPFLKKACDGGNMRGCNVLGNLYLNPSSGLGMDYAAAVKLYERACKGGYENACTNFEETKAEMAQGNTPDREPTERILCFGKRSCLSGVNDGNATLSMTLRPSEIGFQTAFNLYFLIE